MRRTSHWAAARGGSGDPNQVTQTRGQDAGLPAAPCASRPGVTERRQDRAAAPARGWTPRSRGWHKLRKNSAVSLGNCWVRCCIACNGDRHGGQSYRCLSASLLANTIHSATTSAVAAAAKANAHRLIGFPRGSRACGKAPRMSRPRAFWRQRVLKDGGSRTRTHSLASTTSSDNDNRLTVRG